MLCASLTIRDVRLDNDWQFHRETASPLNAVTPYPGPEWESVDLPHSARLEDDTAPEFHSFQGVVWYRKNLRASPVWLGKRVVLKFEAAMQVADVWVNGEHRLRHTGGYLPFDVDLSRDAARLRDIKVAVRLDNRDNETFPPGRPQSGLDFTYAGGLYRNVWLETTEPAHIENVYATAKLVSRMAAKVVVKANISEAGPSKTLWVQLFDPNGVEVGNWDVPAKSTTEVVVQVENPALWDLDRPNLYRVVTTLTDENRSVDQIATRIGIRKLEFDQKAGFKINGRAVRLEGSNRHMAFPVVGNAASDAAQYREAKRLKGLGLNILRLAHYPQSPAFLDACDELGILIIDPIPGWQFFRDTKEFRDRVLSDVRETVVRDRNHPCVAIFETCLNETYDAPDDFWLACHRTAHEAFGQGNFFTGGDGYGKRDYSRPIWDVPWTGWDEDTFSRPALFNMQKGIDREYGDYEFGGEQSSSRTGRADGEGALMLQAWNFIWSHNRNRSNPWSFGDLTWEAIDTHRGMGPSSPVSKSGLLDLYRLPKPVAYFYQSQGLTTPVVHIASRWTTRPSPTKVVVFSNCDEVALLVNGKQVARRRPDAGPTTGYLGPKTADPMYWAHAKGTSCPRTKRLRRWAGFPGHSRSTAETRNS